MGSSKINRVTAQSIRVAINLRLIRNHLIATTRDGDEPAYRSAAAPQLGDGLHGVAARAKRDNWDMSANFDARTQGAYA